MVPILLFIVGIALGASLMRLWASYGAEDHQLILQETSFLCDRLDAALIEIKSISCKQ